MRWSAAPPWECAGSSARWRCWLSIPTRKRAAYHSRPASSGPWQGCSGASSLFLFAGLVVAMVFVRYRAQFDLLYSVDLMCAAAGCVLAIAVLEMATPVQALLTFGVLPILGGALFGMRERRNAAAAVVGIAVMWSVAGQCLSLMESIAKPPHAAWLHRPTLLSEWNAVSSHTRTSGQVFYMGAQSPLQRASSRDDRPDRR